jgi:hypothetical protein
MKKIAADINYRLFKSAIVDPNRSFFAKTRDAAYAALTKMEGFDSSSIYTIEKEDEWSSKIFARLGHNAERLPSLQTIRRGNEKEISERFPGHGQSGAYARTQYSLVGSIRIVPELGTVESDIRIVEPHGGVVVAAGEDILPYNIDEPDAILNSNIGKVLVGAWGTAMAEFRRNKLK